MADEGKFTQADIDAAVAKANEKHEEEVAGLKKKVEEVIADNKKLKRGAEIKPEDLAAAEERAEKAEQRATEAEKQVKTLTTERDKAVKALEAESGFTSKLLIQDGLKSALIANGVKDEDFIDTLTAKFAGTATVAIDGDTRKALIGDKLVADYVKEWAGSDAGKKFVAAPVNSGSGAQGGKGGEGGKTITRQQFDGMSHVERASFAKEGGKVVDQAA